MALSTPPSQTESLPLTPRDSSESARPPLSPSPPTSPPPKASSSRPEPPSRESSSGESGADDDLAAGERSPMLARWEGGEGDSDDDDLDAGANIKTPRPWGEGTWEAGSGMGASPSSHTTRNRRVYGGGRHGEGLQGGSRTTVEVAGMILAGTLSPTPLLLPHAAALLGLPLFLPLLFLTGGLSWFAYIVLGVEARYVGSRSWPSLTSAVFPHRFNAHRVGELLASLLVFLGSIARGVLGVVAASEVVIDLFVPAGGRRWWERVIVVGVIALVWVLLPLVFLPLIRAQLRRRPSTTHSAVAALLRLPAWLALLLWPLSLLILAVRLKQLNIEHPHPGSALSTRDLTFPPAPQPPAEHGSAGEAMGLSIWGGIAIVVFSLSCHHDAFKFFGSLARPPSTAPRRRTSLAPGEEPTSSSSTATEGRRNQWPLACAMGVFGATIIQLGWGLVGYLGLPNGGREGNLLASPSLPRGDGWLILVRCLILLAVVAQIEGNLSSAYVRMGKAIELVVGKSSGGEGEARERRRSSYVRVAGGQDAEGAKQGWDWRSGFARVAVWSIVVALSVLVCSWGESGEGLVSVAEVGGAVLSSLTGFLVPSLFFIALFHLRRPRSIFISDPSLPAFASDTLLLRKEREVQRRLSGRRIWQDVLVFGGLLPFGTVTLVRGCIALATKED
ncbi:hypothetical protein BCR35DRAFT_309333 [Leucosporidium creatinivorum]|uniref:Amino acid transporter transmembrane domain-containing protein n=1 Tax=Leucosporidium creatinivorum TaxID=106004 RepID=A0A1Y2DIF8_9BASI|nr:hypothetical protein BCR35DRAFT_309333 [Leucosporidium creatinivorum]